MPLFRRYARHWYESIQATINRYLYQINHPYSCLKLSYLSPYNHAVDQNAIGNDNYRPFVDAKNSKERHTHKRSSRSTPSSSVPTSSNLNVNLAATIQRKSIDESLIDVSSLTMFLVSSWLVENYHWIYNYIDTVQQQVNVYSFKQQHPTIQQQEQPRHGESKDKSDSLDVVDSHDSVHDGHHKDAKHSTLSHSVPSNLTDSTADFLPMSILPICHIQKLQRLQQQDPILLDNDSPLSSMATEESLSLKSSNNTVSSAQKSVDLLSDPLQPYIEITCPSFPPTQHLLYSITTQWNDLFNGTSCHPPGHRTASATYGFPFL